MNNEPSCKCGKFFGIVYIKMKKRCGLCRTLVKIRENNKNENTSN